MKYIAKNVVRMHDTDMAGILYFPRQFRFAHDALEDFFEEQGYVFHEIFNRYGYLLVIVHAEADYKRPLVVGDKLAIHLSVSRIGKSSFTLNYMIYKQDGTLAGTAKTVHVSVDKKTRTKIPLPDQLQGFLNQYYEPEAQVIPGSS